MIATPLAHREEEQASLHSHVFLAACAFLAGLLCAFNIPVVGSFPAGELILGVVTAAGVITFVLNKRTTPSLFTSPWLWAFLAAEFITLAGYGIADFYRASATVDMARGWSRIAFLSIDTLAIAFLFGEDIRNFRLLLIGAALSGIILLQVGGVQFGDAWKFGYAWPVTILAILCASNFGVWSTIGVLLVVAGIHYINDFRSLCGICVLIVAFLVIQAFEKRQRLMVFCAGAVIAVGGFFIVKTHSSSMDASERAARSNVERSSMLMVAWQAFAESPLIGQGSWFSNSDVMSKFLDLRSAAAEEAGVHGYSADEIDDKVAIHSQLLVSLAEGGILGGIFFLFYGVCVLWAQWYCVFQRQLDRYSAIYSLILIGALWNLLMSPFSGGHRINIAVAIGVLLLLLQERAQLANAPEAITDLHPAGD